MRDDAEYLAPKIIVKSADLAQQRGRQQIANRVFAELQDQIPNISLLCFLDDEDWKEARCVVGVAARGLSTSTRDLETWPRPPQYVKEALVKNGIVAYQHFVYLFGSTASVPAGLAMTLAHELQHYIQLGTSRAPWVMGTIASKLLRDLDVQQVRQIGINSWCDVPIERHAWMTGKRVAEAVLGPSAVLKYIDAQIATAPPIDQADWKFIREIDASQSFDFDAEMRLFMPRLSAHQTQLEQYFEDLRHDLELADIEVGHWVRGPAR